MEAANSSDPLDSPNSPEDFFDTGSGNVDPSPPVQAAERVYQCSCGKTYQSYAALYSHNKQKHGGEKSNLPSGRGGRSRGRPRKNGEPPRPRPKPGHEEEQDLTEDNSFFQNRALLDCPFLPHIQSLLSEQEPASEETATCDEVIAAYLLTMSRRLSESGFNLVTEFIEKFRQCLNEKAEEICEGAAEGLYCASNTAQQIPETANYFISEYLENTHTSFDRDTAISLTMHFCRWLYIKRYSNLKLSIND